MSKNTSFQVLTAEEIQIVNGGAVTTSIYYVGLQPPLPPQPK
jgi:hypothetical protein